MWASQAVEQNGDRDTKSVIKKRDQSTNGAAYREEKYIERDTEAQSNFVLINEQSLNEESYKLGFNKLGQRPNYS